MNVVTRAIRGLVGLFIDDGKLALNVIAVLVLAGLLTHLGSLDAWLTMALLVAGTIGALLANVIRTASTTKR
jgi:hypothetical protein